MPEFGYGIQIPTHVHSQDYWVKGAKQRGWEPAHLVRWLNTSLSITASGLHDLKDPHLENVFVQYRLNRFDMVHFQNITLSDFLLLAEDDGALHLALFDYVESKLKREPVVDSDAGLGAVVQVDAIYHDSFVALPYQWGCRRDAVFDSDLTYIELVNAVPMNRLLRELVNYHPVGSASSSRICRYANANHATWQVGLERFHIEAWKRPKKLPGCDPERHTEGWNELVSLYQFPKTLNVDPERIKAGPTQVKRPEDFAEQLINESR